MPHTRPHVVGVNLAWLVPGVVGGSEEYTVRLLQSLTQHLDDRLEVRLFARPDLIEQYPDLGVDFDIIDVPADRTKVGRIARENSWLAAKTGNLDVVHHAGGTVPFVRPGASVVVTIHDLQPLDLPENFHPAKRRWLQHAIPAAARAAQRVTCPSHFTASRIQELLGVPAHKVRVVPHGHGPGQGRPGRGSTDGDPPGLAYDPKTRFGRYLLYPAIAYPHKRHIDLVQMLATLDRRFGDLSLVFTGRQGPALPAVLGEAARLGLTDRIHAVGRVPTSELESLYRAAEAMVFPSAYEGFGNPALEAMNFACPTVVSDAGALPEVVGDAGLTFPVGNIPALAAAVGKVLADPNLADDLRRRGTERAGRFGAGIAAWHLAEVYRETVEVRSRAR